MKKLISFSGAQSTGKSTLLELCRKEFGHYQFIPEITRTIKSQFGVSINEAGDEITQSLILSKHIENHLTYKAADTVFIMDRCIWDGWVYTYWLFNQQKVRHFMVQSAGNLLDKLLPEIDVLFYTDPADVKLVNDGVRSTDVDFRNDVIKLFESSAESVKSQVKHFVKLSGTVGERMSIIRQTLLNIQ